MGLFNWLQRRGMEKPKGNPGPQGWALVPPGTPPPKPSLSDADLARLQREMEPLKRMCLLPVTSDGEADRVTSKFGGAAWIGEQESWPLCAACKGPMQLVVQILTGELRDLERAVTGEGLLQLFCCLNEDGCETGPYESAPFTESQLARVVPAGRLPRGRVVERPAAQDAAFPSRRIVEWREAVDYPGRYAEPPPALSRMELGLFSDRTMNRLGTDFARPCDKVGGWPRWEQDEAILLCHICAKPMTPIVQIASRDHVPWTWGDIGTGHLQICRHHPERAGWAWECG